MVERKMTLEEAVENHRILWRGIAKAIQSEEFGCSTNRGLHFSIETLKSIILDRLFPEYAGRVHHNCFLCEYSLTEFNEKGKAYNHCEYCPLFNKNEDPNHMCLNGHFGDAAMYVSLIRNDPSIIYREEAYLECLKISELPIVNRKGEEINA